MRSHSSVVGVPAHWSGGHGFDFCQGPRFFFVPSLCHVLISICLSHIGFNCCEFAVMCRNILCKKFSCANVFVPLLVEYSLKTNTVFRVATGQEMVRGKDYFKEKLAKGKLKYCN